MVIRYTLYTVYTVNPMDIYVYCLQDQKHTQKGQSSQDSPATLSDAALLDTTRRWTSQANEQTDKQTDRLTNRHGAEGEI